MKIVDINYFKNNYKAPYEIDENNENHTKAFNTYQAKAAWVIYAILIKKPLIKSDMTLDYTDFDSAQQEAIKFSVSVIIENYLKEGLQITPGGSRNLQQVGYNISVVNSLNPEVIPVKVKAALSSVGLYRQLRSFNAYGPPSEGGSIDTGNWGF